MGAQDVERWLSCWKARGMMRGSFFLLLQATIIYCANIQHAVVSAPKCINGRPGCGEDPVSFGNKTLTLTSLSGISDLPSSGNAEPFKCSLTQPCKRLSLKRRGTMICCPLISGRYGRAKCPNSCD